MTQSKSTVAQQRHMLTIRSLRVRAWQGGGKKEDMRQWESMPVGAAVKEAWETDRMMCQYGVGDGGLLPRLGKAAAAWIAMGGDDDGAELPTLQVLMFDLDCPGGAESTEPWIDEQLALLKGMGCGGMFSWYQTKHGMRLVGLPADPVSLLTANAYIEGWVEALLAAGLAVDEACKRWYRLYRAPGSVRYEGLGLASDWTALDQGVLLPAVDLDALEVMDAVGMGSIADVRMPQVPAKAPTKSALAPVTKRDGALGRALARGVLPAPVGQRHRWLLGAASTVARALKTIDPSEVFELMAYGFTRSFTDKPVDELWRVAQWCTAQVAGEKEARVEEAKEGRQRMAKSLGLDPVDVRCRLIIDAGASKFVWDERLGHYKGPFTKEHQLVPALARHCPVMAGPYAIPGAFSLPQLLIDIGSHARQVNYTYDPARAGYDAAHEEINLLVCGVDDDLSPVFDEDIDAWLDAMGGDRLKDWLAKAVDLSVPVCGLYINSAPGSGKNMLVQGLARLFNPMCRTTRYAELIGTFNPTLLRSPIIWADEHVPHDMFKGSDSGVFRQVVGNGVHTVRELYASPAVLNGYPRVIITANNSDALRIRDEVGPSDLDAIRTRIGYLDPGSAGVDWLKETAKARGFDTTRQLTNGWIRGIARHVLWLAEHREVIPGSRFAVEGWESDLTRDMASVSGKGADVLHVVSLIFAAGQDCEAVRWYKNRVYVHCQNLRTLWPRTLTKDDKPPSTTVVTNALQRVAERDGKGKPKTKRLSVYDKRKKTRRQPTYWQVPAETVVRYALSNGLISTEDEADLLTAAARPAEPGYEALKPMDNVAADLLTQVGRAPEAK